MTKNHLYGDKLFISPDDPLPLFPHFTYRYVAEDLATLHNTGTHNLDPFKLPTHSPLQKGWDHALSA